MEFPMSVQYNGPSDNRIHEVFVRPHEISHSYFPLWSETNDILLRLDR